MKRGARAGGDSRERKAKESACEALRSGEEHEWPGCGKAESRAPRGMSSHRREKQWVPEEEEEAERARTGRIEESTAGKQERWERALDASPRERW